jgi:hypothetical protein
LAKDEDGCAPLSTAGVLSFSLFGEERVGETIGSLIWEGCAALMVHLLTRSCDDPAVTDAVVPSAGASSSVPASRSSPVVPFRSCLAGKRVLELGAGIGVLGCLAAQLGAAHVCITDRKEILHVIQHNITANQLEQKAEVSGRVCTGWLSNPSGTHERVSVCSFSSRSHVLPWVNVSRFSGCFLQCRELQWGTAPTPLEGAPFDFIIASDVIYKSVSHWKQKAQHAQPCCIAQLLRCNLSVAVAWLCEQCQSADDTAFSVLCHAVSKPPGCCSRRSCNSLTRLACIRLRKHSAGGEHLTSANFCGLLTFALISSASVLAVLLSFAAHRDSDRLSRAHPC